MKSGIDVDKLARLQTAAEMRLFRLRGLTERIVEESRSAAAEMAEATRGAAETFNHSDPIDKVLVSLTAELAAMRRAGDFNSLTLAAANARIEAAKRCAGHRARMAALTAERERLSPIQQQQGLLLHNLNIYAGVEQ